MKKIYSVFFNEYDDAKKSKVSYIDGEGKKFVLTLSRPNCQIIETTDSSLLSEAVEELEVFGGGIQKIILNDIISTALNIEAIIDG